MCAMKLDSKYFDRIRTKRRVERPERSAPTCQWDGCEENAKHRAPVGRNAATTIMCLLAHQSRMHNRFEAAGVLGRACHFRQRYVTKASILPIAVISQAFRRGLVACISHLA